MESELCLLRLQIRRKYFDGMNFVKSRSIHDNTSVEILPKTISIHKLLSHSLSVEYKFSMYVRQGVIMDKCDELF